MIILYSFLLFMIRKTLTVLQGRINRNLKMWRNESECGERVR